jgi:hypothetical protein
LDITERRLPQDGRFRFSFGAGQDVQIDLRVSVMPSVHGEDAVLRLLDKARLRSHQSAVSLDLLGFEAKGAALIRELAGLPSGMLLVTGPTGSGKTTTVYAAMSEINTGLEKIITIEDPVEYELRGVLQIPVNERKGLTFAKGLRSILRHDPDRILVGEIRDAETAEIAVQSALTGHLVFTTVPTWLGASGTSVWTCLALCRRSMAWSCKGWCASCVLRAPPAARPHRPNAAGLHAVACPSPPTCPAPWAVPNAMAAGTKGVLWWLRCTAWTMRCETT